MSAKADWIVVAGFLLVLLGGLRIFIMMRSTDTRNVNALPTDSRTLLRAHSPAFPNSRLPMRISLYAGVVLLITGLLLEFRQPVSTRCRGNTGLYYSPRFRLRHAGWHRLSNGLQVGCVLGRPNQLHNVAISFLRARSLQGY